MLKQLGFACAACLFGLSAVLPTSCLPESDVREQTIVQVTGQVVLDGQPVENARVVFIPFRMVDIQGSERHIAYGLTDGEGRFTLAMANGKQGAGVGRYRVLISKREGASDSLDEQPSQERSRPSSLDGFVLRDPDTFAAPPQLPGEAIPVIYNWESILTFDVDASVQSVVAELDLSSIDPLLKD